MDSTEFIQSSMPLCATLGIVAVSLDPGEVVLALDWSEELCTAGGAMHGGALMALADSAGAVCAFLNLPDGASGTSTIESKTNFLRAVRSGRALATARPLHVGSGTAVVETEIRNDHHLVAKSTQTQVVLRGGGTEPSASG
ncbi:MAG TPA: PaaI family thioesterase [Acidimicrobiia bacterium]|nr:PaaI family thioesterase [Acidimicrobiia bacterium]